MRYIVRSFKSSDLKHMGCYTVAAASILVEEGGDEPHYKSAH
jgi:hypothetical protein